MLADWVGGDIGSLARTIELLILYSNNEEVDVDAVEMLAVPIRSRSIFELTDAIGRRDLAQAPLYLRAIGGQGEPALRILALIARQFRLLLRARSGGDLSAVGDGRPNDVAGESLASEGIAKLGASGGVEVEAMAGLEGARGGVRRWQQPEPAAGFG